MVLKVSGADIMNGTPIFDIKPYIKYTDCHQNAVCSFADEFESYSLNVKFETFADESIKKQIADILKNDPRPSYHKDEKRIYGASVVGQQVKFYVKQNTLFVTEIKKEED